MNLNFEDTCRDFQQLAPRDNAWFGFMQWCRETHLYALAGHRYSAHVRGEAVSLEMELTVHLPKTVLRGRLLLGSYSHISLLLSHMAVPNKWGQGYWCSKRESMLYVINSWPNLLKETIEHMEISVGEYLLHPSRYVLWTLIWAIVSSPWKAVRNISRSREKVVLLSTEWYHN
jgi:hypothetical protein